MNSKENSFQYTDEAYRAFKKKRYSEAAILLEKASESERNDPYVYFLLSVACLFANRFDRADVAMKILQRIDPEYIPFLELDAYVKLKSVNTLEDALSIYLELIARYPHNQVFVKSLNEIRKSSDFNEFQKKARLNDFVEIIAPPKKKQKKNMSDEESAGKGISPVFKYSFLIVLLLLSLAGGFLLYRFIEEKGPENITSKNKMQQFEMVRLGGSGYDIIRKINRKKVPEFYYSPSAVMKDFNKAGRLVKGGKYNDALFILNRIHNSNVSFRVQEKVNFLIKFIIDIEERDCDKVPISKVVKKPYMYRGYAVEWTGRITNLRKKKESCSFTLLTDYKKKDTFSGIAEVFCEEKSPVFDNGNSVIVRGIFIDSIGDNTRIHLLAREIVTTDKPAK